MTIPLNTGTAARAQAMRRLDSWTNSLTGSGTDRDKRTATELGTADTLVATDCAELLRNNALASRVARRPAEDMTREWIDLRIRGEKDAAEQVEDWLRRIEAPAAFRQALEWQAAYGGAGILLGVNGGEVPVEALLRPLDPAMVKSIDHLTVFSASELQASAYYANPMKPRFGEPAAYRLNPQTPFATGADVASLGSSLPQEARGPARGSWLGLPEIHESWILRFDGPVASRRQRTENSGWGDSVYQRLFEILRDFDMTWASVANLVHDFAQAVMGIPGLFQMIASDEGATALTSRLEFLDKNRGNGRLIAIDAGAEDGSGAESFKRDVAPLTGVSDVMLQFAQLLAAASDMPLVVLLGLSPTGLGNDGGADMRMWYDHVSDLQHARMIPPLHRLVSLGMGAPQGPTSGNSFEGTPWSIVPRPLWQLDEKEQAAVRASMSTSDNTYLMAGVVTPEEIRSSRFGGDGYSLETQLDSDTRDAFAAPVDNAEPAQVAPVGAVGPVDASSPTAGGDLQALALNGSQIAGLLAILAAVRDGSLPAESAVQALALAFPAQVTPARARALVAPIEVREAPARAAQPAFGGTP